MKRKESKPAKGLSLLELVIAMTMLTVLMTAVSVVLRTSRAAWEAHEADYVLLDTAHATVRHLVRSIRQADSVSAISPPSDNSGTIALTMDTGELRVWDHDAAAQTVRYGVGAADQTLATGIAGLRLRGYRADGVTATTTPDQIQLVRLEVTVQLPRDIGGLRNVRSYAWVRSW